MNISYNWLRELCGTALGPRELAERLTMAGLAVDAVHEAGDDFVLEFDVTSNRPDCLSHLGMAREAAALERERASVPAWRAEKADGRASDFVSVAVEDAKLCPRYTARVVRGVSIAPSPAWLANRLQAIGQRPINNVADITNYVLHELGQPIHAFDLATMRGPRIVVRRARAGERLRTLDGVERELDEQMLVIADAERAVALAGVMGGEETEVTDATVDVLIESAFFAPASVRRTSQVLGLSTDASYRFERGVDREGALRAQERAAQLICEIAGGTATVDAVDVYPEKFAPSSVSLRFERVKNLGALDVPPEESVRILRALGFEPEGDDAASAVAPSSSASFAVPSWRFDVEREEDLVEEVVRHFGYDKIGEELPGGQTAGEYRPGDRRRRAARQSLVALGFDEAVNFSFIDAAHDGRFDLLPGLAGGGDGEDAARLVTLTNPIIEGLTRMRQTLLPGLLDAVRHNLNHGTRNVRLFEMGRVFVAAHEAGQLPEEPTSFALVMTGGALEEGRASAARELDFYDLKGAVEAAADAMHVGRLDYVPAEARHLREGQAAQVLHDGRAIGTLGRLAEETAASYKFRQPVYVAELNFSVLLDAPEQAVLYTPLARFPSVARDISLVAGRRVGFEQLRRAALSLGERHLRGVSLVDVYEGANLPEGKRSLTLRVEYRADDRTLRDEEVDEAHARVVRALEENFGAQQRT
ncbi:MAG TPA: phenylalanine--tRNA ligase subunit beta [Pyrinomonadaceae bacterium]|nr:phenylalanine--tRNA ligase subunit beta [Pyrinomonadaceae bacterium]